MDDIHIPCIVWFHGDPPPDLSGISDPIRIPFTLRARLKEPSGLPTEHVADASGSFTDAQTRLPEGFPTELSKRPGSGLERRVNLGSSSDSPGGNWSNSQTREGFPPNMEHPRSSDVRRDQLAAAPTTLTVSNILQGLNPIATAQAAEDPEQLRLKEALGEGTPAEEMQQDHGIHPLEMGGLPAEGLSLPAFKAAGKTAGVLSTARGNTALLSGWAGPSSAMAPGSPGFDIVTRTHVEGHAAALMRQLGVAAGTLHINNTTICTSCTRLLPRMLAPGSTLNVVLPNGIVVPFMGIGP